MTRLSPQAANGILSYFTRHKTMANLLLVILIVAGLLALPKMRSQFFPDIIIDNINFSLSLFLSLSYASFFIANIFVRRKPWSVMVCQYWTDAKKHRVHHLTYCPLAYSEGDFPPPAAVCSLCFPARAQRTKY